MSDGFGIIDVEYSNVSDSDFGEYSWKYSAGSLRGYLEDNIKIDVL
jgi:hypothetical protein